MEKEIINRRKDLPSFDFFGISAETGLVIESDLEDCAKRATVFACIAVHANVILTAIFWVGMATEGTGGDISSHWANKSTSNFYGNPNKDFVSVKFN